MDWLGNPETRNAFQGLALIILVIWNLYQWNRNKRLDTVVQQDELYKRLKELEETLVEINVKLFGLETKMGLLWKLVEVHMSSLLPKSNPINLTVDEQAAARVYDIYKHKSPTPTLKKLSVALDREIPNLPPDEKLVFVLINGAIKSQLFDRGAWKPDDGPT